jgi:hypothetical protein
VFILVDADTEVDLAWIVVGSVASHEAKNGVGGEGLK